MNSPKTWRRTGKTASLFPDFKESDKVVKRLKRNTSYIKILKIRGCCQNRHKLYKVTVKKSRN